MTTTLNEEEWRSQIVARIKHKGLSHLVAQIQGTESVSAHELLEGFARLDSMLINLQTTNSTIGLRTLSATCFAGHAKFLDRYRSALAAALGQESDLIESRTIMISTYVAAAPKAALFIENFEAFRSVVQAVSNSQSKDHLHVIYSAGYRTSSEFIRDSEHTQTVQFNQCGEQAHQQFRDWWFTPEDHNLTCYFWGDLDFEGIGIVKALRRRFKGARSWARPYKVMMDKVRGGAGHPILSAEKKNQVDPIESGCDFSDQHILPFIRSQNRFCDQEILTLQEIQSCIEDF